MLRKATSRLHIWIIVLLLGAAVYIASTAHTNAASLEQRSIFIADTMPSATTSHRFTFSYASNIGVGSLQFEYCESPLFDIACVAPDGIDLTNAVLETQTGERNYFILTRQDNRVILTRAPAVPPTSNPSSYTFTNVKNPSRSSTFYVRITSYASNDASDTYIDNGAVASATVEHIDVNTRVPPYLKFCVAVTLANNCESTNDDNLVDLGDLSVAHASAGTSQMIAATNAEFGLAIAAYGTTMTSGNNIIPALALPTMSAPGNAQFGLNLRDNNDPNIGQEPSGGGLAHPTAAYGIINRYVFNSGDIVATSPAATDTRKFTASYMVNIDDSQPPGVYTATLTYICTATF